MPHIIVEYSENIEQHLDCKKVLEVLHRELVSFESFSMAAIKSRAIKHLVFRVGDGCVGNSFIHISLAILPGRSSEIKSAISKRLFGAVREILSDKLLTNPISLTLEVRELDGPSYQKISTIADRDTADQ